MSAGYRYHIGPSLELLSNVPLEVREREGTTSLVTVEEEKPLVVISTWVAAKRKHYDKYAEFYLRKGFYVIIIRGHIPGMLWPPMACKNTIWPLADFLHEHEGFRPIVSHSLSVGIGVWGLVEEKYFEKKEKYQPTIDRIKCHIWDSAPVFETIPRSVSFLIFSQDGILRQLTEKAIGRGSAVYENPLLKVPSLMFISEDDQIGPYEGNMKILQKWESMGIKAKVKSWKKSPHVAHFVVHREEYVEEIDKLLENVGIFHGKETKKIKSGGS